MPIAVRELKVTTPDGDVPVDVRILAPEQDGSAWACRYEIGWPHGRRTSAAFGVDAVQALCLALQKIGFDLYMSEPHASGCLIWESPGDGYGFPVPRNARDLLIGSDKRFDG